VDDEPETRLPLGVAINGTTITSLLMLGVFISMRTNLEWGLSSFPKPTKHKVS